MGIGMEIRKFVNPIYKFRLGRSHLDWNGIFCPFQRERHSDEQKLERKIETTEKATGCRITILL